VIQLQTNQRICPYCDEIISYKKEHQAMTFAGAPCKKCSFQEKLKKHYRSFVCPFCALELKVEKHFSKHLSWSHSYTGSLEDLFCLNNIEHNLCKCGCGMKPTFANWHDGYRDYVLGHLDAQTRTETALKISDSNTGKPSRWKGKTKENDELTALRAKATSVGRSKAFEEGDIEIWSKNHTKETHPSLKKISEIQIEKYASGESVPAYKGHTKETNEKIFAQAEKQKEQYRLGLLVPWHKGSTAMTDPRLQLKADNAIAKNSKLGFDYPTRLSLDEVKKRLEHCEMLFPLDTEFKQYQNWLTRNLWFKCKECGNLTLESVQTASTDRCKKCNPQCSTQQRELYRLIVSWGFHDAINNNRVLLKNLELDVTVPSKRVAIEFNGIYWHSDVYVKNNGRHEEKTELVNRLGYKLIHIFEDEWKEKKSIVISMLRHKLGISTQKSFARKCEIVELNRQQRKEFFEENHLEGDVHARFCYGLLGEDGTIHAAMSVRVPLQKNHYQGMLEIARFALKYDTSCVGALGKLTKICLKSAKLLGYSSLMTYVDLRSGTGEGYLKTGWTQIGKTNRRFWWTDFRKRFNRLKFCARNGKKEREVAEEAGVHKIWGCSNLVLKYQ